MLSRTQASVLMDALDVATDSNWPTVSDRLTNEKGWTPEEVVGAWKELEEMAGMSGTTPTIEDF